MKVCHIGNLDRFFEVVDKCEGKVELVTEQGDCLNLHSKISQFVALVKIVTDYNIQQGNIVSYNRKDTERLLKYIKQ